MQHVDLAHRIGESVDFLYDIAKKMDPADGVIWGDGLGDHQVLAFIDFGIRAQSKCRNP
jgi:hypothetical protein